MDTEKGYKKSKEVFKKVAITTSLMAVAGVVVGGLAAFIFGRSKRS